MWEREFERIFQKKRRKIAAIYIGSAVGIVLLTIAVMIFAVMSVDGTTAYLWTALAKDIEWQHIGSFLLIFAVYFLPCLICCLFVTVSARQCRSVLQKVSSGEREQLMWLLHSYQKGIGAGDILAADNYFLYREKWGFFCPRLIAYRDVVWLYLSQSNYDDMGMNAKGTPSVTSGPRFCTTVFYTRDRKKHHIFMGDYHKILERCTEVIQGYGREQKALAQEQFIKWESLGG